MSTSVSVFVFFAVIQVISSQYNGPNINPLIPKTCYRPPAGVNILQCCRLPNVHTLEELKACGIERPAKEPPLLVRNTEHCKRKHCLLRNKGLLKNDGSIDNDKLEELVDLLYKNRTYLEDGIEMAKEVCFRGKEPPQEPFYIKRDEPCEADKFYDCVPIMLIWNCKIEDIFATCRSLKAHMEECKPYLFKNPHQ